jgi:hypothetical protein
MAVEEMVAPMFCTNRSRTGEAFTCSARDAARSK